MDISLRVVMDQVFTVEKLMTPRSALYTMEQVRQSMAKLADEANRYDIIPVVEGERMVAIWRRETNSTEPLTDRWLISRDTPIPDLLELFVKSSRPGFLVLQRQDIVGLVTPADLNKLPARVYFYNLVGELELALARGIRQQFGRDAIAILNSLSDERRNELINTEEDLQSGNVDIDPVQLLNLSDLINIVVKQEDLRTRLSFDSRKQAEKVLNSLVKLRNNTMHLVRPLLKKIPDDLLKLHNQLQQIEIIIRVLMDGQRDFGLRD